MECNVAAVILNYRNYLDTIECVESILNNSYSLKGIVIVENCSDNESYVRLMNRFNKEPSVVILKNNKNLGYAKGNNIGICYARKQMGAKFVLVVNNDTIFYQEDFFSQLFQSYCPGVGVIGPRITSYWLKGENKVRNYKGVSGFILHYLIFLANAHEWNWLSELFVQKIEKVESHVVIHGCAIMFTPDFFRYYNGFYPYTFLYCEENIIDVLASKAGLREVQVNGAELYHKGGRASQLSYTNQRAFAYIVKSMKHLLIVSMLPFSILKRIC